MVTGGICPSHGHGGARRGRPRSTWTASLDVDGLLGFPVEGALDKAERLDFGESLMTHAMVLEGVRLDGAGRPALWKVENSWGKDHGRDGFDTLSDAWFDEYVYQVVVDRAYLTDEERAGDEALPCALDRAFDKASVLVMRGPSYRGRGLDTYSVEAVPQATKVRGMQPKGV